jgi:nucleoid DNA-binding protein
MAKKAAPKEKTGAAKSSAKKALTKNALLQHLAEKTNLTKTQVNSVFDQLVTLIKQELSKKNGSLTLPGLLKLQRKEKPATKERKGRNPQTGAEIIIPAKPKTTVVRARVLKALRETVK